MSDFATYHVGFKLLLWKGDEVLILRLAEDERWRIDLPGGRIDDNEDDTPILEVLKREVTEELGTRVQYEVGPFLFHYRRIRPVGKLRIFVNVYGGTYLGGDIELSHEHSSFKWRNPFTETLSRDEFFNEDAYRAFVNYFKKLSEE